MKFFIVSLALVAAVAADVSHLVRNPEADAQIVEQDSDVRPDGFQYKVQTSNGISSQAEAGLVNVNNEPAINVQGSDSYTAPDGTIIQTVYIANENGYQPQGAHLPTPPPPQPIPEYIQRSLAYIAANPPKPEIAPLKKY